MNLPCGRCGSANPPGNRFCGRCGSPLPPSPANLGPTSDPGLSGQGPAGSGPPGVGPASPPAVLPPSPPGPPPPAKPALAGPIVAPPPWAPTPVAATTGEIASPASTPAPTRERLVSPLATTLLVAIAIVVTLAALGMAAGLSYR
jgi:eukaryotic-like serine/threonine-protein kinase